MVDIPILLKRSTTPAAVPLVGDLQLGELAYNTNDGQVYAKKNDGADAIVNIGALENDPSPSLAAATNLDANSNKIVNLADPTAAQDAASKAYVDSVAVGLLDFKNSVRAASTANINLAVAADPGAIDGVTLANGDRILLKNQTAGAENGIYDAVTATDPTTWVRSSDADISAEVTAGMFVFVEEGTAAADSGWVLSTNDPITLDTTSLTFVQFTGAGQITAGNGLTKTGNTIDVVGTAGRISVAADSINIDTSFGLTGLADVDTTGVADGNLLQYVNANSQFEPVTALDGGTY